MNDSRLWPINGKCKKKKHPNRKTEEKRGILLWSNRKILKIRMAKLDD